MNHLYPLKFIPVLKEKIWGGDKLARVYRKTEDKNRKFGESWEISSVMGDVSVVSNGFLKGNDLNELIEVYMGDLLGESLFERYGAEFPLLIKFIDASQLLSLQVHPDDQLAFLRHNSNGKTEMWYILEAEEGATLVNGFNSDISQNEFLELLAGGKIESKLNYVEVKKDDCIFMPAGRVHCLNGGILLVEIQQTSDLTYRIFDWNRIDNNGQARDLHIELALDAIDYKRTSENVIRPDGLKPVTELISCEYFTTNLIHLDSEAERDYNLIDSFVIFICIEGEFLIKDLNGETHVDKGETVLIPAAIKNLILTPKGKSIILEVFIQSNENSQVNS